MRMHYQLATATRVLPKGTLTFPIKLQEAQADPAPQMILPLGTFFTRAYGKLEISAEFAGQIVDNWRNKVMGERQPFVDSDHDWGKANGWITALEVKGDGLYATIEWTPLGESNVKGRLYRYFSADIGAAISLLTGDEVYPVLVGVALTNVPVMNIMPPVKLSESGTTTGGDPAHGDGAEGGGAEGEGMEIKDIIAALKGKTLTDAERTELVAAAGIVIPAPAPAPDAALSDRLTKVEGENKTLSEVNTRLTGDLKALQTARLAERKQKAIGSALADGRLLPKDKESWEKKFDENPDFTEKVLADLPVAIDLTKRGTGSQGVPAELTDEDEQAITLGEKTNPKFREEYVAARKAGKL